MDSRFDLMEIWKDEEKRKKIIAISVLILVCGAVLFFYYGGNEEETKELTEIPMTDAEQIADYNNKLEAINDTIVEVNYFQKDLDAFFSESEQNSTSQYDDEERKADSLSRVFAVENRDNKSSNLYTFHAPNLESKTSNYNSPKASNQSSTPAAVSINTDVVKSKQQLLDEKRNALKSNNESNTSANKINAFSIAGVVRGTQTKKANEELVLKTTEDMSIKGVSIPKNTYLYGRLQFSNNRALAHVTSINVKGTILPVDIELYGLDGNRGLPIQNSNIEQTTDVLTREAENVINRVGTVGRVVNAVGNTLKPSKDATVTFIDNQAVILFVQ